MLEANPQWVIFSLKKKSQLQKQSSSNIWGSELGGFAGQWTASLCKSLVSFQVHSSLHA